LRFVYKSLHEDTAGSGGRGGGGGGIFVLNMDGSGEVKISGKGIDPNWKRPAAP
jgi:hypothetical protein